MTAAVLLYNGDASDTGSIITALSTIDAVKLIIVPNAGGQGVAIFEMGTP